MADFIIIYFQSFVKKIFEILDIILSMIYYIGIRKKRRMRFDRAKTVSCIVM